MSSLVRGLGAAAVLTLAACAGSPGPAATGAPASPTGGLPSAVVIATNPPGGCSTSSAPTTVSATVKDYAFSPDPIQAKVGDVITWTNGGPNEHTATLDGSSCGTANLNPGDSGSLTFTLPGTYHYHCEVHPTRMKGTIVVGG